MTIVLENFLIFSKVKPRAKNWYIAAYQSWDVEAEFVFFFFSLSVAHFLSYGDNADYTNMEEKHYHPGAGNELDIDNIFPFPSVNCKGQKTMLTSAKELTTSLHFW